MKHLHVGLLALVGALSGSCGYGYRPARARLELAAAVSQNSPVDRESSAVATVSGGPIDQSPSNPFFRELGANGRRCGTCHRPEQGWTITPSFARTRPAGDPLFAFDGSDCLPPGVPNAEPGRNSTEMLRHGNVRIELPIPAGADFTLIESADPLGCPHPPSAAALRLYRRPLPVTNSSFLTTVMSDGRENISPSLVANLARQAKNAAMVHARATYSLTGDTLASIVAFETDLFTARQTFGSLELDRGGVHGGPEYLRTNVLAQYLSQNEPASSPSGRVFDIYRAWEPDTTPPGPVASSIGRGEAIFNSKIFTIAGVPGLNGADDPSHESIRGTCGTCHDNRNVGNHVGAFDLDMGIAGPTAFELDVDRLPIYTFRHEATKRSLTFTDPGRGLVTGKFADLGKFKVPTLRGLIARAPYFHNGSAASLADVVEFYERRFSLVLTSDEREDLVAFLSAL